MGTVHQFTQVRNNFRRDRFFNVASDGWYVEAREGAKGPFLYRVDAELFLDTLKCKAPWKRIRLWKETLTRCPAQS